MVLHEQKFPAKKYRKKFAWRHEWACCNVVYVIYHSLWNCCYVCWREALPSWPCWISHLCEVKHVLKTGSSVSKDSPWFLGFVKGSSALLTRVFVFPLYIRLRSAVLVKKAFISEVGGRGQMQSHWDLLVWLWNDVLLWIFIYSLFVPLCTSPSPSSFVLILRCSWCCFRGSSTPSPALWPSSSCWCTPPWTWHASPWNGPLPPISGKAHTRTHAPRMWAETIRHAWCRFHTETQASVSVHHIKETRYCSVGQEGLTPGDVTSCRTSLCFLTCPAASLSLFCLFYGLFMCQRGSFLPAGCCSGESVLIKRHKPGPCLQPHIGEGPTIKLCGVFVVMQPELDVKVAECEDA